MKSQNYGFLNLRQTLTSGQCFRAFPVSMTGGRLNSKNVSASRANDGSNSEKWVIYAGVDENVRCLTVTQDNLRPIIRDPFWMRYFDLDFDYDSVKKELSLLDLTLKKAIDFASGIVILNQDPWEALCSFVVSQNNNIKRIAGIISRMCEKFGKTSDNSLAESFLPDEGLQAVNTTSLHGFPSAETLSRATEEELRQCGLGFRAEYISCVSRAVCNGEVDFDELKNAHLNDAVKKLTRIKGIGPKVASCALLFGIHRLDAFPIDTWIKKAMLEYYPGKDASFFGEYAGIAQQFLFYYIRKK